MKHTSNTKLALYAISVVLIASIGLTPAFGQTSSITVATDESSYYEGDTIIVTGEVRDLYSGTPVSIVVTAPNNNIVRIAQLVVGVDKQFEMEIQTGGAMKVAGLYTITAQYGTQSRSAETSFEYGDVITQTTSPIIETDKQISINGFAMNYQITNGKVLDIIPSAETSSLTVQIDSTKNGKLIIEIPRAVSDSTLQDVDADFVVMIGSNSVRYNEVDSSLDSRTLSIPFPNGTTEIQIIGTFAVPEFGAIAVIILAVAIISVIVVTSRTKLSAITMR